MFAPTIQTAAPTLGPLLSRLAMIGAAASLVILLVTALSGFNQFAAPDESLKLYALTAHYFGSCAVATVLFSGVKTCFYRAELPLPDLSSILPALFGSLVSASLLGFFSSYVVQDGLMLTLNGLETTKVDLVANTIAAGLTLSVLEWFENPRKKYEKSIGLTASLLAFLWTKYGTRLRQPSARST